jgi:hypothetical protein
MSERKETFFDLYARGDALEEEVDDHVDRWHEEMVGRPDPASLGEYLGLAEEEYRIWAADGTALPRILRARRDGPPSYTDGRDVRVATGPIGAGGTARLAGSVRRARDH